MKIVQPHNQQVVITPDMSYKEFTVDLSYINARVGVKLTSQEAAQIITRMQVEVSRVSEDGKSLVVKVPPTRSGMSVIRLFIMNV